MKLKNSMQNKYAGKNIQFIIKWNHARLSKEREHKRILVHNRKTHKEHAKKKIQIQFISSVNKIYCC